MQIMWSADMKGIDNNFIGTRMLSDNEIEAVGGGAPAVLPYLGLAGAILYFAYEVGRDMAERDAKMCPV
ncbi:hypothetical protein CO614_08005 [Lysobacteraceae bacterium NML120232]|nr:hypothetical protein CO614_08005 [Xanthomonadaceae bacterium NML120232]